MRLRPLSAAAAVTTAALVLTGCGGSDFDGEADVPDGYATYRGEGVTFVHPEGWKPETRDLGKGITPEHLDASVGDLGAMGNPQVVDQHRHVRTLAHERSACPGG